MSEGTTHLFEEFDCSNDYQNSAIAGLHWISGDTKDEMIARYFTGWPIAQPVKLSRAVIGLDDEEGDCYTHRIEYYYNEDSYAHTEVSVSLQRMNEEQRELALEGAYSLHFFRGLDVLYDSPDSFEFSKARDSENRFTLVITAFKGTTLVYQGDLTHMIP